MNDQKVPLLQKFGFLIGMGGSVTVFNLTTMFAMLFFTDLMGLNPAAVGTMLLIAKIIDAVFDPLCGALIDRTNTRFGKVRPWVFIGAIITFIVGILVFVVPGFSDNGKLVWSFVTYTGVNLAFTACTLGIITSIPLITTSQLERVSLSAYQYIGQTAFSIVTTIIIMPLITYFSQTAPLSAYWKTSLIVGGIGLVGTLFFVFVIKENKFESQTGGGEGVKVPLSASLLSLVKNKYFLILCIIVITTGIATAMHQSALAQYLIYGLKAPELASALMPLLYIGAFVAALLAKPLARFDKLRMAKLSFLIVAFGLGLRFFTGDATMLIVIAGEVILGLGAGLFSVYVLTLLMDTIEYGYLKNGTRNDGLIMSTLSFQQKIGQGVGISIMGFWLAASGYVSGAPEQSEAVADALFNIHLLPLLITSILSLIVLQLFYKLDAKTVEGIISDIKARDEAAAEGAASAVPEAMQDGEES